MVVKHSSQGKWLVCASHVFYIDLAKYFETASRANFVTRATLRPLHFASSVLLQGCHFRYANKGFGCHDIDELSKVFKEIVTGGELITKLKSRSLGPRRQPS